MKKNNENQQQEWMRYYVVADFANFKKEWAFSSKNREELFAACVNFAMGFVNGYCINNENTPISTNACQSIDGFIWWNTITGKNVVYIKNENGEIIKK